MLDLHTREMVIHRYRCTDCKRTFRSYPPGVDRVSRSRRIRTLAAITWALGLSLDSVVDVFRDLGLELSRTTIWRDGQNIAPFFRFNGSARAITLFGEEDMYRQKSLFVADEVTLILKLGDLKLRMGIIDEDGPYSAKRWLESLAEEAGLEVTVDAQPKLSLN